MVDHGLLNNERISFKSKSQEQVYATRELMGMRCLSREHCNWNISFTGLNFKHFKHFIQVFQLLFEFILWDIA